MPGQGVQLSCQGHLAHPPSSDHQTSAHSGVQPDTVSAGLMQCCVAWSSSQQYSEAAVHAEHCGACRSAEHQAIAISATPPAAALAPGSTMDRLQTGLPDIQDPPHFHPGLPQPSYPASHCHSSASLFYYAMSLQTYYQNQLRRLCFSLLCSCCLEFTNC